MNKHSEINLATLFRSPLEANLQHGANTQQELLNQPHQKIEDRASVFLFDRKFALNLDELI